jgi:hypothetical protein
MNADEHSQETPYLRSSASIGGYCLSLLPALSACRRERSRTAQAERHNDISAQPIATNWARFFKSAFARYLLPCGVAVTPQGR